MFSGAVYVMNNPLVAPTYSGAMVPQGFAGAGVMELPRQVRDQFTPRFWASPLIVIATAAIPPVGTDVSAIGGVELDAVTVMDPSKVEEDDEPQPVSTANVRRRHDHRVQWRSIRPGTALPCDGSSVEIPEVSLPFILVIASLSLVRLVAAVFVAELGEAEHVSRSGLANWVRSP
jgi:hypothetical protein